MMIRFSFLTVSTATTLLASALGSEQSNFDVHYGVKPQRFELNVTQQFVEATRARVRSARHIISDLGVPVFSEGPTLANATAVADHWANEYNWTQAQQGINKLLVQLLQHKFRPTADHQT